MNIQALRIFATALFLALTLNVNAFAVAEGQLPKERVLGKRSFSSMDCDELKGAFYEGKGREKEVRGYRKETDKKIRETQKLLKKLNSDYAATQAKLKTESNPAKQKALKKQLKTQKRDLRKTEKDLAKLDRKKRAEEKGVLAFVDQQRAAAEWVKAKNCN